MLRHTFILPITGLLILLALSAYGHDRSNLDGVGRGEARLNDGELRVRGEGLPYDTGFVVAVGEGASASHLLEGTTDDDGEFDVRGSSAGATPGAAIAVIASGDGSVLLSGRLPNKVDDVEEGVGTSPLVQPLGAEPSATTGRVRVKADDGRHVLEIRVRSGPADATLSVCATNADGVTENIGEMTTGDSGNGTLKIDTRKGGSLPFGAGGTAELAGLAVDVKDADGNVLLTGTIPTAGQRIMDGEIQVEFDLNSVEESTEPSIRGDVKFESEPQRDKVRVRLDEATAGATYMARISRGEGSDVQREQLAMLTADEDGKAEHEVRGRPVLPFGAGSPADLAGDLVEVLRVDGETMTLVLSATVPAIPNAPQDPPRLPRLRFDVVLQQPSEPVLPRAHGKVEFEEQDNEHEIEVEVEDLQEGADYTVTISNGAAQDTLFAGASDAFGDIRTREVIFGGEALPLGVSSFAELNGATIEVRDAAGAVVLSGVVEAPAGAAAVLAAPIEFTTVGPYDTVFLRGDSDGDGDVSITDAVNTLNYLFLSGRAPDCADRMDSNDDSAIDISDPLTTLLDLFLDRAPIAYPGTSILGSDRTADSLYCRD